GRGASWQRPPRGSLRPVRRRLSLTNQSNESQDKHNHSEAEQDQSDSERRRRPRPGTWHCSPDISHPESPKNYQWADTNHHPILVHVVQRPFLLATAPAERPVRSTTKAPVRTQREASIKAQAQSAVLVLGKAANIPTFYVDVLPESARSS